MPVSMKYISWPTMPCVQMMSPCIVTAGRSRSESITMTWCCTDAKMGTFCSVCAYCETAMSERSASGSSRT